MGILGGAWVERGVGDGRIIRGTIDARGLPEALGAN